MSLKASLNVGALTAGPPDHVIEVTVEGDSIKVEPDYVLIHAGESVQWRFCGIQGTGRPEIRFINPADKRCGPFNELVPACCPGVGNGARVYTLTGPSANTQRCRYEYEARVNLTVAGRSKWIGVDPVIDNEGGPPGVAGG